jgi:glucokinase
MRLVADIGGTNARVALCENGVIQSVSVQRFSNADWDSLEHVLAAFCARQVSGALDEMVIAVAGPVQMGKATLTNRNWNIVASELVQKFGCKRVVLLNDLTALGYAVPMLSADQTIQIYGTLARSQSNSQALVVGVGTGFNVSQVIETEHGSVCPSAEAGHVSMPLSVAQALESSGLRTGHFPTVETLFSGRGFTAFCRLLTRNDSLTGEAAIASYGEQSSIEQTNAVDHYAMLLGLLLRELSLSYLPSHGIFLAGSVAHAIAKSASDPMMKTLLEPHKFRSPNSLSVFAIDDDSAALLGCAHY